MMRHRRNSSGQVLIVAALAIAFLISATIVYTYQTSQVASTGQPFTAQDFIRNVKLGSRNLIIGCLVNVSNGGNNETLETGLKRWSSFVESQYYLGKCVLEFELCGNSLYSDGLWINWNEDGSGVASAKADFTLNLSEDQIDIIVTYPVNITSSFLSNGAYYSNPAFWQDVNIIIKLFNEGKPALADNLTVYYKHTSGWRNAEQLSSYLMTDYGNGTYSVSFTVSRFWTHQISVRISDKRNIFVQTGFTPDRIIEDTPIFLVGTGKPELSKFDNITWTSVTHPSGMGAVLSMDSNAQYWIIGCSNKKVFKYDGQDFTDITPVENSFTAGINAVSWGDNCWLVGDGDGRIQKYNGSSWTDLTAQAGFNSQRIPVTEIEWNEDFGYWLIGSDCIVKKFDGSSWTDVSPTVRQFEDEIGAISCDGSTWLVGDLKGIIQKYNGTGWTDLTVEAGFYSSRTPIYAIDWGDSCFLVGGKDGIIKIYDGTSWSDLSSGWGSKKGIYAIEYSDTYSYWLVGGENGEIRSFNGSTWTDRTSQAGLSGTIYALSAEYQC